MQHLCPEYKKPRNEKRTRVRGWIRKDTRIGPVLNIKKVCYCDEQYSIEVQVPSLFQDDTVFRVRIVNGVDRYVTESMPTAKEEDIASGKPIAKARPRQKPTVTLTSDSIPVLERIWIEIKTQRSHDQKCYRVSKAVTRLLRHDQSVRRGSDRAILQWHHRRVQEGEVRRRFAMVTWRFDIRTGRRRRTKEKISILREFQTLPINSCTCEQFKDIQEKVPLILRCKTKHCYRKDLPSTSTTSVNSNELNSIKEMDEFEEEQASKEEDKQSSSLQWTRWRTYMAWEKFHAIWRKQGPRHTRILGHAFKIRYFGCNLKLAQERGLQFYQTRSHAVVLYNTLPAACIGKRYVWKLRMSSPGSLNSESATSRAKIGLTIWSTRSTKPRRKIILGTIKRFEKLRWNLQQHRGLQNYWRTSLCSRAAGYNTWEQGQEVDREVREPRT